MILAGHGPQWRGVSLALLSLGLTPGVTGPEDDTPDPVVSPPSRCAVATPAVTPIGTASWYGPGFEGQRTARGERFDPARLTAAHRWLPLGTLVRITHLATHRQVVVTITDRGPYVPGRFLDLSRAAAHRLGMIKGGLAKVKLEVNRPCGARARAAG
jgi:rare lipoprotein A